MDLYIPKHLKKLGVLNQLCQMIEEYGNTYYTDVIGSFDNYKDSLKRDPVKYYITLCIGDNTDEGIINYLTHRFYLARGTMYVFIWMVTYLGIKLCDDRGVLYDPTVDDISDWVSYTPRKLAFKISDVDLSALGISDLVYSDALKSFLDALLYFSEYDVNIGKVTLTIDDKIISYVGSEPSSYRYFKVED